MQLYRDGTSPTNKAPEGSFTGDVYYRRLFPARSAEPVGRCDCHLRARLTQPDRADRTLVARRRDRCYAWMLDEQYIKPTPGA